MQSYAALRPPNESTVAYRGLRIGLQGNTRTPGQRVDPGPGTQGVLEWPRGLIEHGRPSSCERPGNEATLERATDTCTQEDGDILQRGDGLIPQGGIGTTRSVTEFAYACLDSLCVLFCCFIDHDMAAQRRAFTMAESTRSCCSLADLARSLLMQQAPAMSAIRRGLPEDVADDECSDPSVGFSERYSEHPTRFTAPCFAYRFVLDVLIH
ncbi:hypothetical protein AK812_SmicGene38754 [Symbiodinium microadriaticum]|uniref:Uncharacterized protein n=1 Tax=Symbiodinium microadriaticum TaxID=2951 RepID=A0A1Q9CCY9_SYMMI|nr:hypothetical protein AK812_SmicGene38754 [Symbiodinium microadriaticum]